MEARAQHSSDGENIDSVRPCGAVMKNQDEQWRKNSARGRIPLLEYIHEIPLSH